MVTNEQQVGFPISQSLKLATPFATVIFAALRFSSHQDLDSTRTLLFALGTIFSAVVFFVRTSLGFRKASDSQDSERDRLLSAVESAWIDGVLEPTVGTPGACEIDLHFEPDAILNIRTRNIQPELLTSGEIVNIFKDSRERLLLMGNEDCGKTILMLQLLKHLIARARVKETAPVPIVLSLADWQANNPKKHFQDWLTTQLHRNYPISQTSAGKWVRSGKLVLLLDDLDKLTTIQQRQQCVNELNTYLIIYAPRIVVCCRTDIYRGLTQADTKLDLGDAVDLQPLTEDGIITYLNREEFTGLRFLYQHDNQIRAWAKKLPLLNMMAQAYYDQSPAALTLSEGKTRYGDLIATYTQAMVRYDPQNAFDLEQTKTHIDWFKTWGGTIVEYKAEDQRRLAAKKSQWRKWLRIGRSMNRPYESAITSAEGESKPEANAKPELEFRFDDLRLRLLLRNPKQRRLYFALIVLFHLLIFFIVWPLAGLGTAIFFVPLLLLLDISAFYFADRIHVTDLKLWSQTSLRIGLIAAIFLGAEVTTFGWSRSSPLAGVIFSALSFLAGVLLSIGLFGIDVQQNLGTSASAPNNQQGILLNFFRSVQLAPVIGVIFTILLIAAAAVTPEDQLAPSETFFPTVIGMLLIGIVLMSPGTIYLRWYFILRTALRGEKFRPPQWTDLTFFNNATRLQLLRQVGGGYRFRRGLLDEDFDLPHDTSATVEPEQSSHNDA